MELGDDKDCAICFEELSEEESLKQCKQCKKYFHQECLKAWLIKNTNCPLCRFNFEPELKVVAASVFSSFSAPPNVDLTGLSASDPLFHLRQVSLLAE